MLTELPASPWCLRTGEDQAFAFLSAIHEVHAQTEVESLAIIEESQHHIGGIAAIFPETQAARGHGTSGTVRPRNEVSSAEQVNEEVSRDAGSVSFPLAPLKEVLGIERNLGRCAQESRPVAGLGRGIERNGIVPRANGGITVPVRGHHIELTDRARGEQFFGLGINDGADTLAANLQDAVHGAGGLDHLRPIAVQMNHWLLAIHVLARLHRVDGSLLVPMVRGGDEDGVDVLARKDLAVIAGGENVVPPDLLAMREPAVIAVGDSNKFHARNLYGGLGVSLALNAGADERELNMIVGRNRAGVSV
jgi:hypothetical protein